MTTEYCSQKTFSIIILSYNRCANVEKLLQILLGQDLAGQQYEIIVSDDASTDGTEEMVKKYQSCNSNIKFVKNKHSGVGNLRNQGLKDAANEFILFLADDYMIDEDFLNKAFSILKNLNCDILKVGVNFFTMRGLLNGAHQLYNDYAFTSVLRQLRLSKVENNIEKTLYKINNFSDSTRCIFKRKIFKEEGLYKTSERGEDTEYADRISQKQYSIYYAPDIVIRHVHTYTWRTFLKYNFSRGKNILVVPRLAPDNMKKTLFYLRTCFTRPLHIFRLYKDRGCNVFHLPILFILNAVGIMGTFFYFLRERSPVFFSKTIRTRACAYLFILALLSLGGGLFILLK